MRHPTRELDDLEPARDLTESVVEHLAMLSGDHGCELIRALVQQLAEVEQDLRPLSKRGRPPGRERRARGTDRGVDICIRGERDVLRHSAGRRVIDLAIAVRRPVERLTVDPVRDKRE